MDATPSLFFYDLETSGRDPRRDRIMQFAGRRTAMDLSPMGEPVNVLVRLTEDVLPEPDAVALHGITPQRTVAHGITEYELVRLLMREVFTPGTILAGYNNISFDDNFIRYLLYRNFQDPYAWAYKDDRSRWDLIAVTRLTRALRPEGITWPTLPTGEPTLRLDHLTTANGIEHARAHSAMSDVDALIQLAQLVLKRQPRLFHYLFDHRSKAAVAQIIKPGSLEPFVYSAPAFGNANLSTTVAVVVAAADRADCYIVWDLRHDPTPFLNLSPEELSVQWFATKEARAVSNALPVPAHLLAGNKSPAVAPLAVLDAASASRLGLDQAQLAHNRDLLADSDLGQRLAQAAAVTEDRAAAADVDAALYDGFISDPEVHSVRQAAPETLATLEPNFTDARLPQLFTRYLARNFAASLGAARLKEWESYRARRILADTPNFTAAVERLWADGDAHVKSLMEDLTLWHASIYPADVSPAD